MQQQKEKGRKWEERERKGVQVDGTGDFMVYYASNAAHHNTKHTNIFSALVVASVKAPVHGIIIASNNHMH